MYCTYLRTCLSLCHGRARCAFMASPCSGGISRENPPSLRILSLLLWQGLDLILQLKTTLPATDRLTDHTQLLRPPVDGLLSSIRCGYPASRDSQKVKRLPTSCLLYPRRTRCTDECPTLQHDWASIHLHADWARQI